MKQRGFTLIELMIVIVVLSILVGIAYPTYLEQVRKSRRSDAKVALTQAAAAQERWFTENNSYTNNIANIGGATSPEGYYTLTVSIPGAAGCTSGTNFFCFQVTATPTGAQAGDDDCQTLSIDHTGNKTATGNNASECW